MPITTAEDASPSAGGARQAVPADSSPPVEQLIALARQMLEEGNPSGALELMTRLPLDQQSEAELKLIGALAKEANAPDTSANAFGAAFGLKKSPPNAYRYLVALLEAGRTSECAACLRVHTRAVPSLPRKARLGRALGLYATARRALVRDDQPAARLARTTACRTLPDDFQFSELTTSLSPLDIGTVEVIVGDAAFALRALGRCVEVSGSPKTWIPELLETVRRTRDLQTLAEECRPLRPSSPAERLVTALMGYVGAEADHAVAPLDSPKSLPSGYAAMAGLLADEHARQHVALGEFLKLPVSNAPLPCAIRTPFIVVHRGASRFAAVALRSMVLQNGQGQVIHLGDRPIEPSARFAALADYSEAAGRFAALCKQLRDGATDQISFRFQRWFYAWEFMEREGLEQAVILDSDVLVYSSADGILASLPSAFDITNWPWTCVVRRRAALEALCRVFTEIHSSDDAFAHHIARLADYRGTPTEVGFRFLEIQAFEAFRAQTTQYHVLDLHTVTGAGGVDGGLDSLERFEPERSLPAANSLLGIRVKRIEWVGAVPFATLRKRGRRVRMNTLHFQGLSKALMGHYLPKRAAGCEGWLPMQSAHAADRQYPCGTGTRVAVRLHGLEERDASDLAERFGLELDTMRGTKPNRKGELDGYRLFRCDCFEAGGPRFGDHVEALRIDSLAPFGNSIIQLANVVQLAMMHRIRAIYVPQAWYLRERFEVDGNETITFINAPLDPGYSEHRSILQGAFFHRETLLPLYARGERPARSISRIRHGFAIPTGQPLPPSELVVHLRAGDVFASPKPHPSYGQPPLAYYRLVLQDEPWSHVHLVFQNAANPVIGALIEHLRSRGIPFTTHSGSIENDVGFLRRAVSLVCGRGSFVPAVAATSAYAKRLYTYEEDFASWGFDDLDIRTVHDTQERYRPAVLQPWTNSAEQRRTMLDYPLDALKLAAKPKPSRGDG